MTTALPRVEREQHWKSIWKDATHKQDPVTITVADIRKSLTYDEELYSTDHDMSHI